MSLSEHDVQNAIRMELARRHIVCFRANVGKVRMADGRYFDTGLPKGFSDLFGFKSDGKIFFIEVKNKSGRIRPEQEKFIERMRLFGALAGVARSVEEALDIIEEKTDE
ncbi:VRR-NUC domain-containing protein [Streptococcus sp. zg-86]|uniref:VRR-NUC domain-containing protein n=1 Tax=Streptococcus zhangguiae TaxID=2664091 RepID=A0A6I4RGW3_9STRE|nr:MULTISPECIES: VRR-NUC domain-containing protein [unclassified Streptococcus]MTB64099.1 VRR-NUC domain-containing protein [Streptococcus sp. zg-86]MTB90575.1 VRR-NUC domain-containing protein [Streptococcus sp. zg-36]MWV56087.1 VRR-NUC domain-containing protein [Streptococcus sp. zg-70]QTH48284.1 VRR-NUC domain-containing protein [Streptococcus sp. zg-86]